MGHDPDENGEGHVDSFDESEEIEEEDIVTIVDEEGNERDCVVLAVAEVDGQDYALLAPAEQLDDDEGQELELFIFTYEVDDEEMEMFGFVEDEAVYEKVREFFSTLISQEDDEDDEDEDEGEEKA